MTRSIGLLHPGETGAPAGATARRNGEWAAWSSDGHCPRTRRGRAEEAGLAGAGCLPAGALPAKAAPRKSSGAG